MNKKFRESLFLSLAVLFSVHVYAQQSESDKQGPPVVLSEIQFAPLEGGNSDLLPAEVTDSLTQTDSQRAPAPPLTQVYIPAVGSSNCDWEYMTSVGQNSTVCNHGGVQLRVVVQEIGYGGAGIAWMNGNLLPSSAKYFTQSICVVGGSYVFPCPAGYTIVGWMKYYNLDGYQSGTFKYQNTSLNSPWNTMFTQIYIQ
ncbi:DUF4879 domain-containing protein [Chromatium okenii]|uniref:YolA family protein n=1 Tax=Chromatium okenii TaxID=61644 RepID=UPI0019062AC7|nr:YolA family protein [Chromatium okenii]MBK1641618.1 DUF4879 domain-containing protein [Chromatium okenii]